MLTALIYSQAAAEMSWRTWVTHILPEEGGNLVTSLLYMFPHLPCFLIIMLYNKVEFIFMIFNPYFSSVK